MRESLRHLTLEALAEQTVKGRNAAKMRESAKQQFEALRAMESKSPWTVDRVQQDEVRRIRGQANAEWARAEAMLKDAMAGVVRKAQVVTATCSGSGARYEWLIPMHLSLFSAAKASEILSSEVVFVALFS